VAASRFLIHHILGVSVQFLCLPRGISNGGKPYPAGDGERAEHVEGNARLGTTLPYQAPPRH
jgi:hypothetical protein